MFERFKRDGATAPRQWPDRPRDARENGTDRRTAAPLRPRARCTRVRARQREEYGGINWGAAFFGWLVAVGLGALLVGLLAAAGAAVGLTDAVGGRRRRQRDRDRRSAARSRCSPRSPSPTSAAATSAGACRASTARARASARG